MMISKVSDFVQDALYIKSAGSNASQAFIWGCVNSIVLTILFYDLHYGGYTQENIMLWWCATVMCIICAINMVVHLKSYLIPIFVLTPLEVTEKQRRLMSVSDSDLGFKPPSPQLSVSTPAPDCSPKFSEIFNSTLRTPPPQALNSSTMTPPNKSWYREQSQNLYGSFASSSNSLYSNTSLSPGLNLSQTGNTSSISPSITANSWSFHGNRSSLLDSSYNIISSPKRDVFSPSQLSDSLHGGKSAFTSLSPSSNLLSFFTSSPIAASDEAISSKTDLTSYLKDFHEKERKKQILCQNESSNGGSNSLWAYSGTSNSNYDLMSSLRQNVYQPASKDAGFETNSSLSKIEDSKMTYYSSVSVSKIWLKRNVTPKDLFQYEENLRIWLAMNILQPLVALIDSCNEALMAVTPELKVGHVGVDKLKKAAQNITGIKQLNYLLPFLDMTVHQDYLVQRVRELSKGGAISAFKWNSGGSFNGKPWREEYPTDTYILLHMFSMYMDNHLPPDPTQPDGRVFSNVHVVKTPEKPLTPASYPCLYLTQMNPPHLKLVLPPEEECEVGGGHKNFVHALVLFCHHLVHQQHSLISGVNLKMSGINLAWVVNAE